MISIEISVASISTSNIPAAAVNVITRFADTSYLKDFSYLPYVNSKAPKGGTLRLSLVGTFDNVNKDTIKGTCAQGTLMCYDSLMIRLASNPSVRYGLLAKAILLAPDNSAITFYLNPKAKFQDDSPVTAADVKATIETLRDRGLPRYKQYYDRIAKIEIIDNLTIKFSFKPLKNTTQENYSPENATYDPELPLIIADVKVLKKSQIQAVNFDFPNSGLVPIMGSGPYKIKKIEQGRSITFERNPNYWARDLAIKIGQDNFDCFVIDYYPNYQAQFEAFKKGDYDVHFETNPNQWDNGYNFPAFLKGNVKRQEIAHRRPVPVRTIIFNMRRPIFKDRLLRQALALSFDFDSVNNIMLSKSLLAPHSLFANTVFAHQGNATGRELNILNAYKDRIDGQVFAEMVGQQFSAAKTKGNGDQRENLQKADLMLKQAGWVLKQGKRVNSNGQVLKLEFLVKDPRLEKIGLSFRKSLEKLGVELTVRTIDTVQYENRVIESDFDMIVHTWSNSLSPGNEQAYYFSAKNADINGSSNYIGLKDPIAEELAKEVAMAKTEDDLKARVHALDRYVMYQYCQIPLSYQPTLRWAYWENRLAIPEIDPIVGLDVMSLGWCPTIADSKNKDGIA